jgi:mannan endo-1,4-beta-mannosidase
LPFLYWELISNPDPHQGEDYEVRALASPMIRRRAHRMAIQTQVNAMDADWILLSNASLTAAALTNAPFDFSAALALNESATGEEYLSW